MPSPSNTSPADNQQLAAQKNPEHSSEPNIDSLNHSRALARQQQTTRTEQIHYVLQSSREPISHW